MKNTKTIVEIAGTGKSNSLIRQIAKKEKVDLDVLIKLIATGKVVIPANRNHDLKTPCGIGKMMSIKINANIGSSPDNINIAEELKKLKLAISFGADTFMDLSVGGNIRKIQSSIIARSSVPIGTVPIYEATINAQKKYGSFYKMKKDRPTQRGAGWARASL